MYIINYHQSNGNVEFNLSEFIISRRRCTLTITCTESKSVAFEKFDTMHYYKNNECTQLDILCCAIPARATKCVFSTTKPYFECRRSIQFEQSTSEKCWCI